MLAVLVLAAVALAQAPTFEAASVKPTTLPDGVTFGEGGAAITRRGSGIQIPRNTSDPSRVHYPYITLKQLLKQAWPSFREIEGPTRLDTEVFSIEATFPSQTTPDQFREMLRTLIIERFALKFHSVEKDVGGYELVVALKGLKAKPSSKKDEPEDQSPRQRPTRGSDGFLILPPRTGPWCTIMESGDNRIRMVAQQQTMHDFAGTLANQLNAHVTDSTGLTTKYDFTLTYAGEPNPGAPPPDASAEPFPNLYAALQSQLGLKLEHKKVPMEIMHVDHIEKVPVEN